VRPGYFQRNASGFCPRLDLLIIRWSWLTMDRCMHQAQSKDRRPWARAYHRAGASMHRTIGLALVSPQMVSEVAVSAGWPPVMTLDEAAAAMRISPQTLRRYVSEGKFKKSVKRGWPVLFWRDTLISEFMKGSPR
jgi:hypothetical protein